MNMYIWATDYQMMMSIADSIEEAKEMIRKETTTTYCQYNYSMGETTSLSEYDLDNLDKVLQTNPLVYPIEKRGLILNHANE